MNSSAEISYSQHLVIICACHCCDDFDTFFSNLVVDKSIYASYTLSIVDEFKS
jgi:hypothetical protein